MECSLGSREIAGFSCSLCNKKFDHELKLELHYEPKMHHHLLKLKDYDEFEIWDASACFMCYLAHDSIENCMVHMHKSHGFFIPNVEYLKDPIGFLTYLGLKLGRRSEAYGGQESLQSTLQGGGDNDEGELEDFYDYTTSYVDSDGKQLVLYGEDFAVDIIGFELVITRKSNNKTSIKTIVSREFLRYYRQNPRPTSPNERFITASLASRYISMGLAIVQSKERLVRMKMLKPMTRSGAEAMRSKIGMKSNVIRNLPENVPR